MIGKRTEFVSTIERLNDELEEVKVRHLVGEYSDTMLSEREDAQKTEIAQWHDKTERIEKFITRYQALLDTERELNPLETLPEPEQEAVPPAEEITQAEEADTSSAETPSLEMEVASLIDNLSEDIADEWEATIEEDVEITTEGDLDEEDFPFDELPETTEELQEEQTTFEEEIIPDETEEDLINCKRCGRTTPASEKFCVNCGAKAR
jgi:hypothetical protein